MFINFTWEEFDKSVELISYKSKEWDLSGIYGIPRGGLCLAVALSHKLNLELLKEPKNNILIVDDIYDSGKTLHRYKDYLGSKYFVLISKKKPLWWESVQIISKDKWVVFPWEEKENRKNDMDKYHLRMKR